MVKGDKVICIHGAYSGIPAEGKVYTITTTSGGPTYSDTLVRINGSRDFWHISRFVPATPLLEALS